MLTLHTPTVADKVWIDPILEARPTRACEYNFTTIYLLIDVHMTVCSHILSFLWSH